MYIYFNKLNKGKIQRKLISFHVKKSMRKESTFVTPDIMAQADNNLKVSL